MQRQTLRRRVALPSALIFLGAGFLKILAPFFGPGASFGDFLAQTPTPFPRFFGIFVPVLEIVAGLGLLFPRTRRICALLLVADMMVAIGLVGIPGLLGREIEIEGVKIGGEWWRLPLEIGLLFTLVWLVLNDNSQNDCYNETR